MNTLQRGVVTWRDNNVGIDGRNWRHLDRGWGRYLMNGGVGA